MAKLTLSTVGSLIDATTAATTINSNFDAIETAVENTLSRNGTLPNTMGATLDMNSFHITNLPAPISNTSPLRLQDLVSFVGGGTIANIPAGGSTGQYLTKLSGADYNTGWTSTSVSAGTNISLSGSNVVNVIANPNFATSVTTPLLVLNSNSLNNVSGTGQVIALATSPALVTPNIGAATATSVNKVAITAPASTATLTIANTKTLTCNNTLTLAGSDSTTITFQGTDTYVGRATTDTFTNKTFNTASTGNDFRVNSNTINAFTGTGSTVVLSTAPTITTSVTCPLHIGGTGAGSTLTLQSTSGAGTTDQVLVKVGNNGGTLSTIFHTDGKVSHGTTSVNPDSLVTIMANTAATVAPTAGTHLHIVGADAASTRLLLDNFGNANVINARHASGTLASKTATANASTMFAFGVAGWDGSAYYSTASLNFVSTELFSGTAGGAEIQFFVTPNASHTVAQAMTLRPDGGLTIGGSGVTSTGFGGVHAAGGIQSDAAVIAFTGTAIPAGGTTGAGLKVSSTANFGVFFGSGAPSLSAAKGSLYLRSDGSTTNDRAYINTNGTTTWTAITTVA